MKISKKPIFYVILITVTLIILAMPLNTLQVSASENTTSTLELKEGMMYRYNYFGPAGYNVQIDFFITNVTSNTLQGISVKTVSYQNNLTTTLIRFKIDNQDLRLFETNTLSVKKVLDDKQNYNEINSESSQSFITLVYAIVLVEKFHNFSMNELIEKKLITSSPWTGDTIANITLETTNYHNYNAYKINSVSQAQELLPSTTTTYYVCTVYPYSLIHEQVYVSGYGNYVTIDLASVEQKSFNTSEYPHIQNPFNIQPIPKYNISVNHLTIEVNASASYDSDGSVVLYQWDFGDGTNGTGVIANHTYRESGNYSVKLYIVDDMGGQNFHSKKITVQSVTPEKKKTPGFEFLLIALAAVILIFGRKISQK